MHSNYRSLGQDPKSGFDNRSFANPGTLLHNNLYNNILSQEIKEYSVLIDSADRNYKVYTDPFEYTVQLGPLPGSRGNEIIEPYIQDKFENVRYIKLECAVLPNYVWTVKNGNKIELDGTRQLKDELYVVLNIPDIKITESSSTNDLLSESFGAIYYDHDIGKHHYMGYSPNAIKVFPPDNLGTINRLNIRFSYPNGEQILCDNLDSKLKQSQCDCSKIDRINDNCFKHNLMHPKNPSFQHHLHFKIGVVQSNLSKRILS